MAKQARHNTPATERIERQTGEVVPWVEYLRRQVERDVQINAIPTHGVSRQRHETSGSGTGAGASADGGEIVLDSGTDASGTYHLRTTQRGTFIPGGVGEAGVGIRVPSAPTGSQDAKWGYYDSENGFGFGVDSTGVYIFYRRSGTDTKVYQSNWNRDPLDGNGGSGLTLDQNEGNVYNILFEWYGHGAVTWRIDATDSATQTRPPVVVHREVFTPGLSIETPNQPINAEVDNGGTASSLTLRASDMQFAMLGVGQGGRSRRTLPIVRRSYTISSTDTWEPVIAVRKKSTLTGRPNSVRVDIEGFNAVADSLSEFRITWDATTSATYGTPSGTDASETAVEVSTAIAPGDVSDDGLFVRHGILPAAGRGNDIGSIDKAARLPFGDDTEVLLWVRSGSSAVFDVISLTIEEQR